MALPNLPIKTGHVFIGLAVLMGLLTMFLFGGHKQAPTTAAAPMTIKTENVVVPLAPISEGKTLSMNDITTVKWPSEFLPKGSFFAEATQVVGRVTKQDLFPGEPIFKGKLSGSDTNGGLPAVIPTGMRAVTVAVTEIKGVAGFVKPGDRVDVLTTFELDKSNGNSEKSHTTRTVLQNVLVLASAQTMVEENKYNIDTPAGVTRGEATPQTANNAKDDKDAPAPPKKEEASDKDTKDKEKQDAEKAARLVSSVTLALTPAQTETLALAEETGDIRLSLRPETDHAIAKLEGANFEELLNNGKVPMPKMIITGRMPALPKLPIARAITPPPGAQVEFIQGTDKTLYNF
jgi:Flp pilus assembly protein CpaB